MKFKAFLIVVAASLVLLSCEGPQSGPSTAPLVKKDLIVPLGQGYNGPAFTKQFYPDIDLETINSAGQVLGVPNVTVTTPVGYPTVGNYDITFKDANSVASFGVLVGQPYLITADSIALLKAPPGQKVSFSAGNEQNTLLAGNQYSVNYYAGANQYLGLTLSVPSTNTFPLTIEVLNLKFYGQAGTTLNREVFPTFAPYTGPGANVTYTPANWGNLPNQFANYSRTLSFGGASGASQISLKIAGLSGQNTAYVSGNFTNILYPGQTYIWPVTLYNSAQPGWQASVNASTTFYGNYNTNVASQQLPLVTYNGYGYISNIYANTPWQIEIQGLRIWVLQ